MIRQQLSQKLLQKLSPQQIQLMKLLQIPTVSLEQRIKEELEANPALEEPDNYSESPPRVRRTKRKTMLKRMITMTMTSMTISMII